jgi:uncharacterized protein YjbJ (UPF0337 family)
MTKDKISGNWKQLVGQIKKSWGKLTDQDLEKAKGNMDILVGLIQEKYGETKDTIEIKVNKMLDRL